jgi:hypothetical protein
VEQPDPQALLDAVRQFGPEEAALFGRQLFVAAHQAEARPRQGAVLHALGCLVLDEADRQRYELAALDPDVDNDEGELLLPPADVTEDNGGGNGGQ